jgi:hypothetical protein
MSNHPLRKESNCLNCGAEVTDRFCSHCGQENIEPRENFWQLLVHFFNDFTHFDGKFFSTLRVLLFQPGKLTREFLAGKRASYIHPIRLYLFSSFAFFIFFFLIPSSDETKTISDNELPSRDSITHSLDRKIFSLNRKLSDSISEYNQLLIREKIIRLEKKRWQLINDSTSWKEVYQSLRYNGIIVAKDEENDSTFLEVEDSTLLSVQLYELQQRQLPPEKRDNWLERILKKRWANNREKYNGDEKQFTDDLGKKFLQLFPKLLFVSLPLSAWFLLILYRRQKKWWYTDHAIFTLYQYSGSFVILLVENFFTALGGLMNLQWLSDSSSYLGISAQLIYIFLSLYRFYEQSFGKTLFKLFLFLLLQLIAFFLLFLIFLGISFITI